MLKIIILIYVYDFLALWTFFVELMEIGEQDPSTLYPNLIFAQGEVPEEAPQKDFLSRKNNSISNDMSEDDLEGGDYEMT